MMTVSLDDATISTALADSPIAITGMGLVSALGTSAEQTWRAVRDGCCGAAAMDAIESPLPDGSDGCQAPPLPVDFAPQLPREARYLRWTVLAALEDADAAAVLHNRPARCATMVGTTLHGMRAAGRFLRNENFAELRDFLAGDTLRLALADLGLHGGAVTTCSACSSSLGSIALAVTLLRTRQADLVVAGGYDAISEYAWAGFNALRLVSAGPLKSFSRGRSGMKIGEGYGIVVLERLDDAQRRGASIRAIVAGCGESADAHHLTQPHPTGEGAARAMNAALQNAAISPADVGLVAAHATATPDNDAAEFAALSRVFAEKLPAVPVVAFKTHLGHALGGAGAAELILSAMALRDGVAPACVNVAANEIEFESLNFITRKSEDRPIHSTLNTSLGFGGANTCVALTKNERATAPRSAPRPLREVCISGLDLVMGGAIGRRAFVEYLERGDRRALGSISDSQIEPFLNARRTRRMSGYVKLMLAAATLAARDARLADQKELLAETAAMLGTTHGAANFSFDYYRQIVRDGVAAANPMLFAEGVPNVGAAQLSMMLGLQRACQAIIGTRTAGLDALRLAWLRVASGEVERAIVGAAEESSAIIDEAYLRCALRRSSGASTPFIDESGFTTNPAAVALVIETPQSAEARGVKPYATIERIDAAFDAPANLPRTIRRLLAPITNLSHIMSSANGTWLDRAEQAALHHPDRPPAIQTITDRCGEAFSATPLLGLAARLLRREPTIERFTVLCSDYTGGATAATIQLAREVRDAG